MAQNSDEIVRKRKGKGASVVVWVLMAMLVLGLGGFGVTNFGGGLTSIGQVGDRDIDVNTYARALQQEIAAFGAQIGQPVTAEQALALGLDSRVRQQLVATAALDNEADRVGLSAGDARVAEEIAAMRQFQGTAGQFDAETYRLTLQQNNLTPAEFERDLRADVARSLLQGAVAGGFVAPAPLTDTLYAYIAERRGFSLLALAEADLPSPLPEPTPEELKAHYDANIAAFTRPEARRITYAALLPDTLAPTMAVDEAAVRAIYDDRIDEFVQPERRLVERLVFPDEAAAAAAKARIDAGETFEAIVAERGLSLLDIDMGDQSRADLGAAGEAVFALTEPGVVGPLPSDLGPALFRMNAILAAQETPFEDVRDDLVAEFSQDAARRAIGDRVEEIDDMLASGTTLEDLAETAGLELGTLDFTATSDSGMAAYPAFREAAAAVGEGDFPEVITLNDGGLATIRLDEIVPPTPIPLDEATEDVTASWRAEALAKALADRAAAIKAEVEGGASLGAYGIVAVTPEIARDGFVEDAPADLLPAVFQMAEGELRVISGPGFTGLVRLDSIRPGAAEGDDAAALKGAIAGQAEQALAQDALTLFTNALTAEAGIRLDQTAIDAVHAQFR
ncbi:peptidyl-prolyl cis-trans isomerase [Fertoebacter nigrum]|uniref:Peptidyl-prolyl cis-trans isomerase n=1 Tax=Fertoeibacter niger TaxID=2656921 RepID=A0A8X8GSU4_9RHOB|nr:peptidylprolyl isomerase [Fertoeibacter niger]NUB43719.1 peptidyl-prolyl cis-trans isomerase [Fertoeibacter niger]